MVCRFIKIYVLLLCCACFAVATFAQNSNSTITGTVRDASGAVVPGATVNLTNVGTNQQLSTTSGSSGSYTFTNLSPAKYQVSVTAQGFAQWVGLLTLRVSEAAQVNPSLIAASVSTKVIVRDVTPVIDRVNATLSDVKNANTIETLPVQNRSILNVLAFSPGVVAGNYGGSGGGYTRVNGIPGGSVDYLVDGQTMSDRYSGELISNPQPIPTFQEVKIITSNGDAQYSRPGVVELVSKSGTNQFHGQLFELNQNNYLRARPAFSGPSLNYLMHNEFGGQIGGPVWLPKLYNGRNKTFFFVDLEGIRENGNVPTKFTVPTQAMRGGDLSGLVTPGGAPITIYDPDTTTFDPVTGAYVRTPFPGNIIPTNRLNAVSQKILTASYGVPEPNINNPTFYQFTPNYIPPNGSESLTNKLYTAKVDQLFGPNRLALRYTYTDSNTIEPLALLNPLLATAGGHNGAVVFTQVLGSHAVNVLRGGAMYDHKFDGPVPIGPPYITTELGLPAYPPNDVWPSFNWNGPNDNYWSAIGRDNPKDNPDQIATVSDQFSYNRGHHQLMFGFGVQNYRTNTYQTGQPGGGYSMKGDWTALQDPAQAAAGTYNVPVSRTGSGLANTLLGEVNDFFYNVYPVYHTRQTEFDGFALDNWQVTPNLTLNLGLRYQYWTAFADSSGVQATFDPNIPGGMEVYQGSGAIPSQVPPAIFNSYLAAGLPIESAAQAGYPLSLWNMPKNNFEPRLGFAYQIGSNSVLRGGWGIYQWVLPLANFVSATRGNAPFSDSFNLGPGTLPNGVFTDSNAAELEFPIASAQYAGPQGVNQFVLGSQGCTNVPAGTCTPPGMELDLSNSPIVQDGGFSMEPVDPNYKPQTVQEYNLTYARQLPKHIGFQLSYIGNHSYNQIQMDPINYTVPRDTAPPGSTPEQLRQYPVFETSCTYCMSTFRDIGYSNTNSLQAQVQHTFGSGLLLQSYFTWQRTLTTTEEGTLYQTLQSNAMMIPAALTPGYSLTDPNSGASTAERLRAVYAPDSELPTKTFSFNAHYEFPFGRGKRYLGNSHGFVNALVSGYNISPFFLWHSGFYFAPYFTAFNSSTVSPDGVSGIVLSPGKTGILPEGERTRNRWFDASVYDPTSGSPYAGQTYTLQTSLQGDYRNNIPNNYMTGPGFNELDATVYKLTPITKSSVLDIEAQIFNVYNHQNLSLPNTNGIITAPLAGSLPRLIQLQAKYTF
jgi:hypothetical protein